VEPIMARNKRKKGLAFQRLGPPITGQGGGEGGSVSGQPIREKVAPAWGANKRSDALRDRSRGGILPFTRKGGATLTPSAGWSRRRPLRRFEERAEYRGGLPFTKRKRV